MTDDEAEDLRGMVSDVEVAAYKAGLKRGYALAARRLEKLDAELRDLQDTIREALRITRKRHHGNIDTLIGHYLEAFDLLQAVLKKETEMGDKDE